MKKSVLILTALLATNANALETLSSKELLSLCQSDSDPKAAICTGYVNGFIDGAFATDPRVAERVVGEMREEESFSQRAMRTRLGIVADRYGPSYYAGFCIPADMGVDVIVSELREAMIRDSGTYREKNARDYVYDLLQTEHPCSDDEKR